MKKFVLALMAFMMVLPASAYDPEDYKYELENVINSSTAGYVTLKVWSYGKREKLTRNKCMANAVHGILFKGLDASEEGSLGKVDALVPNGYESNPDYFDKFFEDAYLQYVQVSNKGTGVKAGDAIKVTKKEYKVGMLVKINHIALRNRLEKDGIITGVRSLFTR